ncbi:alpha/beta hydrolase [Clostridium carnis]
MTFLIITFIIITFIIIAIAEFMHLAVNKAFKKTILRKRKDKEIIIKELKSRYNNDFKKYVNLKYDEIIINSSDGYKLKGFFYNVNNNSKKIVIIHHGYSANHYVCLQFAELFFNEGFNALLIDMRSHGESDGKYVTYGYKEREDLDIWVDLMREKVGNDGILGLHGQSMGGATVLMYGGKYEDKIDFIVADCAYSNGRQIIKEQFKKSNAPFFPLYILLNRRLKKICRFDMNLVSPIDDIKNSKVPVLFIHGTNDNLVPYKMSEEMYNSKGGNLDKLLLVDGAKHVEAYATNNKLYKDTLKEFLDSIIK